MTGEILNRVVVDPQVMAGKPIIRNTRIPVDLLVLMVGQGIPEAEILREYPRLEVADIRAALTYAAQVVAGEAILPVTISR